MPPDAMLGFGWAGVKRVLLVSMGIDIPGGIANVAGSMLTALDTFVREGQLERVDVLTYLDDVDPSRSFPNGRTYRGAGQRPRFALQFVHAVRSGRPNYIIFDVIGGARLTRLPIPGLRAIPYAIMVHDAIDLDPGTRSHLVPILQNADLIIANSPTTSSRVGTIVPDRAEATVVVAPPVSAFRAALWSKIKHRPLSEREPIVLIASRLDADQPGKGHDALLRAWPTVLDAIPAAQLVVAGDGSNRIALENLATSLGLGDSVEFVGYVSAGRLGELFADARVFAMPSRQEGFGIAYAEAMWHGTPCIGSTADAAVDVIENEDTGLLVPYGDVGATAEALLRILGDPRFAEELGSRSRQICLDRYSSEAYEERLASVLHLSGE